MGRLCRCVLLSVVVAALVPSAALAAFPWKAGDPSVYRSYKLPPGANQTPNDLTEKRVWMYASTPGEDSAVFANDKRELNGVRGAHLADAADVDQAWRTTT